MSKDKTQVSLSVVIATHNEEANLPACLDSLQDIADEVLIADGESTDQTVAIAKRYGAHVLPMTNKRMFHFNKEEAAHHAKGEWILFLDADEHLTAALRKEIKQVLDGTHADATSSNRLFQAHMHNIALRDGMQFSTELPINGYFIARKNFFLGRYLMHSGVYPDGVIRLVRRGKGYWPCKDVHETMVIEGGVGWLKEPMIHMADPTFHRYLERANRYTSLTADQLAAHHTGKDIGSIFHYMVLKPLSIFVLLFVRHKGFLDGFSGFVWSLMSGLHWPMAYMKYWEKGVKG